MLFPFSLLHIIIIIFIRDLILYFYKIYHLIFIKKLSMIQPVPNLIKYPYLKISLRKKNALSIL